MSVFVHIVSIEKKATQRLTEIPEATDDISEMIKKNLNEVQSQNRACLTRITSLCLRYLARQRLPLRGHGNNQDSNFKPLKCHAEDDLVFSE